MILKGHYKIYLNSRIKTLSLLLIITIVILMLYFISSLNQTISMQAEFQHQLKFICLIKDNLIIQVQMLNKVIMEGEDICQALFQVQIKTMIKHQSQNVIIFNFSQICNIVNPQKQQSFGAVTLPKNHSGSFNNFIPNDQDRSNNSSFNNFTLRPQALKVPPSASNQSDRGSLASGYQRKFLQGSSKSTI